MEETPRTREFVSNEIQNKEFNMGEESQQEILDDYKVASSKEISRRNDLLQRFQNLSNRNHILSKEYDQQLERLSKYFSYRNSKLLSSVSNIKSEENTEERYLSYVREHMKQAKELQELSEKQEMENAELQKKLDRKREEVDSLRDSVLNYKITIARESVNSRTGQKMKEKVIQKYEEESRRRDDELRKARTKYLLTFHRKSELDDSLKDKEYSNGLHLIDFEQYKMENAQLNDKIEEKNETLQKSKVKAVETVHILTHVNEKLQFIQERDVDLKKKLSNLETKLSNSKNYLTKVKKERDAYKVHNQHLKDTNPLIGNNALLEDYENRKTELEELKIKLKQLQHTYSNHTRKTINYQNKIRNIKRKIEYETTNGGRSGGFSPSSTSKSSFLATRNKKTKKKRFNPY